jgi:hypothetical protein
LALKGWEVNYLQMFRSNWRFKNLWLNRATKEGNEHKNKITSGNPIVLIETLLEKYFTSDSYIFYRFFKLNTGENKI